VTAVIPVMVLSKANDRRSKHFCFFTGHLLHQSNEIIAILSFLVVFNLFDEGDDIFICIRSLIFYHYFLYLSYNPFPPRINGMALSSLLCFVFSCLGSSI